MRKPSGIRGDYRDGLVIAVYYGIPVYRYDSTGGNFPASGNRPTRAGQRRVGNGFPRVAIFLSRSQAAGPLRPRTVGRSPDPGRRRMAYSAGASLRGDSPHASSHLEECNIAFLFASPKNNKLRGREDLKDSLTIDMRPALSPITPCAWGHIAEASQLLRSRPWPGHLGRLVISRRINFAGLAGRFPYRYYCDSESDGRTSVWQPRAGAIVWKHGCRSPLQLFSPLISIAPYAGPGTARLWLLRRFPTSNPCRRSVRDISTIHSILISVRDNAISRKVVYRPRNHILSLTGAFPSPLNDMCFVVPLGSERADKWAASSRAILHARRIAHSTLESLIGRLNSAQTAKFSRFARGMTKPLFTQLNNRRYNPASTPTAVRVMCWWAETLLKFPSGDITDPADSGFCSLYRRILPDGTAQSYRGEAALFLPNTAPTTLSRPTRF